MSYACCLHDCAIKAHTCGILKDTQETNLCAPLKVSTGAENILCNFVVGLMSRPSTGKSCCAGSGVIGTAACNLVEG